jgi:hypothetical protein
MEYANYDCDIKDVKDSLDKYGVAVVPDIFSSKKCKELRNSIWSGIKDIQNNRFDIKTKLTWKYFFDFFPLHGMLIQHHSIAHLQAVWDIRQDEQVKDIFSTIHDDDDLLTSFDGISVSLPPETTNRGWYRGNDWMHMDQGPTKKGFMSAQGMITLYDVNEGDATLSFLEGSHNYHEDFFEYIDYSKNNKSFCTSFKR